MIALTYAVLAPAHAVTPSAEDGFAPGANAQVVASAIQPDGRIVVGGYFTELQSPGQQDPISVGYIARINTDGSIDTSFNPKANGPVKSIHLLPGGQILIGGYFTSLSPGGTAVARNRIARLNSDGTVDATFDPNVSGTSPSLVHVATIRTDSSGRVLIGGEFSSVGGTARSRMARLNADGSLDTSFSPAFNNLVSAIAIDTTGRIVVGGGFTTATSTGGSAAIARKRLARLSDTGAVDANYDPSADNLVAALAFQADGKLIAAGNFMGFMPNGATTATARSRIARILDTGALDANFNSGLNSDAHAVTVTPDGKIVVSGMFRAAFGTGAAAANRADFIARFEADGSVDTAFYPGPSYAVSTFALQSDGKIFIGGYFTECNPAAGLTAIVRRYMARLNEDGTLDTSLNPSVQSVITTLVEQSDGKILVGGSFSSLGGVTRGSIARISADGTIDPVFNPNTNGPVVAMAVQSDGKVIIGGNFSTLTPNGSSVPVTRNFLARVNPDGTLDASFNPNPNNFVTAITIQPDGSILIGGGFSSLTPEGATEAVTRNALARLTSSGAVDTNFNPAANGSISAIVLESDNRILVGGGFSSITNGSTTVQVNGFARLNTDGTVVTNSSPVANGRVNAVRLLSGGKILIGGEFTQLAPPGATSAVVRNRIAIVNADGSIDTAYDPSVDNNVTFISAASEGKVYVSGPFTGFKPNGATDLVARKFLARLNADGTVDSAFNPGPDGSVFTVLPLSGGGILVSGQFTSFRSGTTNATLINRGLAKLSSDGVVDTAFRLTVGAATGEVRAVAYPKDGTMYVGGSFAGLAGSLSNNLVRMRSEGIVDSAFVAKPNGSVEALLMRETVRDPSALDQRVAWLESNGLLRTGLNLDDNLLIDGVIEAIAVQSDGKIIIGGNFGISGPDNIANLARFNTDGSLDTGFQPEPDGAVFDVKIQGNGDIVIGGNFTSVSGVARRGAARVKSSGELDTFDPTPAGIVYAIAIQSDGKIVLGGTFTSLAPNGAVTPTTMNRIARVNSDGSLDTAYNPSANADVTSLAVQSDGKLLVGGLFTTFQPNGATTTTARTFFARLNTDGTVDASFDPAPNSQVTTIRLLPGTSGRMLLGGFFTTFKPNGAATTTARNRIAVVNSDGTLDTTFNADVNGAVLALAVQSDGSFLLGGLFTQVAGIARNRIARVSATGTLDTTFNPNAASLVNDLFVLGDESIIAVGAFPGFRVGGVMLAGGEFTELGSSPAPYFALVSVDGTPVTGAVPAVDGAVRALARDAAGRVYFGGDFANAGGTARPSLARLLDDDTLDAAYNPGTDGSIRALALQDDGSLLVGGTFTSAGGAAHANLARINANGSVDAGFNASTDGAVSAIAVQADGRILVAGSFTTLSGTSRTGFGRLNADGTIDAAFAPAVNGPVRTIAVQTDGSILIGGSFTSVGGTPRAGFAKVSAAGALDATYDAQPNGPVSTLLLAPDGKLFVGGTFTQIGGEPRYLIARLLQSALTSVALEVGSDKASLNWRRTGSAPEITGAHFEISTDGKAWTSLGAGSRDNGVPGWRIEGVTLPLNTLFYARATANVASNRGGSVGLIETVRAAFVSSSSGGSGGSEEPPEIPARPANFLAETYLSANPELSNALYGLPDRLDLAWAHYWIHAKGSDTEAIFLPPGGQSSVDPRMINLSARSWIGPGDDVLIMGVNVADAPARLLVRALGPSLAAYGIPNPLADPSITVYAGATPIASNDDWATDPTLTQQALDEAGVAMNSSRDSAMVITLQPGLYTFVISGKGGTGVGLGEMFLLSGQSGRLTNLSARARVGEGNDILIAGFSRVGVGELLVRGLGPELAKYNIASPLADPFITLHRQSTGTGVLANNDWGQVLGAISDKNVRAGALPLPEGSKDAAAYMVLGTGGYTIHVSGAQAGQTGVALIELFELR